jgi:hypothetical protein
VLAVLSRVARSPLASLRASSLAQRSTIVRHVDRLTIDRGAVAKITSQRSPLPLEHRRQARCRPVSGCTARKRSRPGGVSSRPLPLVPSSASCLRQAPNVIGPKRIKCATRRLPPCRIRGAGHGCNSVEGCPSPHPIAPDRGGRRTADFKTFARFRIAASDIREICEAEQAAINRRAV